MEMDPYYLAPLGADPLTFAALQARAVINAGIADERSMAEVAVRSRGEGDVDALLAEDYLRRPLRRHDVPPITDGAAALVLADREPCPSAGRTPGLHHRLRPPDRVSQPIVSGARRLAVHPAGRRDRRPRRRSDRGGRAAGCLHPRGTAAVQCAGPRRRRGGEPVGRGTAGQPDHGHWTVPHRLCRRPRDERGTSSPGSRHFGTLPATEPDLHLGGPCREHRCVCGRRGRPDPSQVAAA